MLHICTEIIAVKICELIMIRNMVIEILCEKLFNLDKQFNSPFMVMDIPMFNHKS